MSYGWILALEYLRSWRHSTKIVTIRLMRRRLASSWQCNNIQWSLSVWLSLSLSSEVCHYHVFIITHKNNHCHYQNNDKHAKFDGMYLLSPNPIYKTIIYVHYIAVGCNIWLIINWTRYIVLSLKSDLPDTASKVDLYIRSFSALCC